MTIRNESNFNNYMKDFGQHPKELKKTNCVAIFLVALGVKGEKANKWAEKGIFTFAPLQTYLAKKGQELVKNYNIKQVERNVVKKEDNISEFAAKVLNTQQKAGNQIFLADDHTSRMLTLKQNEDKIEKLFVHHKGEVSQRLEQILKAEPWQIKFDDLIEQEKKDINFLLVLVYSTDREALLSHADNAADFNRKTGLEIDVYLPTNEWGQKVKEELQKYGLDKQLEKLITPTLFDKSNSDLEIFRNIMKINEWLKEDMNPEIFQMLEDPSMNYQKFSDFMLQEMINPATPKRKEFINQCNEAKINPALTMAALNQLEKQWFFTNLSSDAIKGLANSLQRLSDKNVNSIVVALNKHIERCVINGDDPFAKEQLRNFELRVNRELTGEQIEQRKTEFLRICNQAKLNQGLAVAVIKQIDNQGFVPDLDNEKTMNGVIEALKKLLEFGIGPTDIVVGLKDYLEKCNVEEKEPFTPEKLKDLEARIINPTDLIRTAQSQYGSEWKRGLKPQGSPLIKPFLEEFGSAVPFPKNVVGWEPGDAQKLIFEQMVDFAKKNPNLSPESIVKAFKKEVIAMDDRNEYKNAYYLKDNVVPELKNRSKALQRLALYAEIEKLLIDKNVTTDQVPLLVEYLITRVNLGNQPLSKEGRAVLEHLVTLVANPLMTAEEKGRILSSMQPKELFDLSKIDNLVNRLQTLTALFKKPSGVSLAKVSEMMQNKPGSIVTPMFKVLMNFFKDNLDTREGTDEMQDEQLGEVQKGLNKSSYLKVKLEQALKSFLPKAGANLITIETPTFISVDLPTFSAGMKVAVDEFTPPPSPLTIEDHRQQAVHKVMEGIITNVQKARTEESGLSLFLKETWPDLQNNLVWKIVRRALTEKNVHIIGRVVAKLAGPITFFANRYFDKAIARERAFGNEAKAQLYEEVKGMFRPLLMLFTSLVPGIVQRHAFLRVGEEPLNIEGVLNILSAAVLDPDFNQDKQNQFLNDLKPYLGQFFEELAPYGDLINNLISAAAFQGTEEARLNEPK